MWLRGYKWHVPEGDLTLPCTNIATHPSPAWGMEGMYKAWRHLQTQGRDEGREDTKGHLPRTWAREDKWSGGPVVGRAS